MRHLAILVLLPSLAYAGDAIVTNVDQPEQKFYLELSSDDLHTITMALGEIPKRVADAMIMKINGQLSLQSRLSADYANAMSQKDTLSKEDRQSSERKRR